MFKKRKYFYAVSVAFLLILGACGGGESQADKSTSETGSSNSDDVITVSIAHSEAVESMYQKGAEKLQELIEEKSNGRMKVELYPNGQLGDQRSLVEQTQMGSIEMVIQNPFILGNFVEEANIMSLPYLWPNEDIIWEVMDSDASQLLNEALEERSLKSFGVWAGGFKGMTSVDNPILSPDDLVGLDFRVIPSEIPQQTYNAWGAIPEPIDYGELYNALQLGVVSAQDNTFEGISDMKFYEVQEYLTVTDHEYFSVLSLANLEWFESLPTDLQDAVTEAQIEAREFQREITTENEMAKLEELRDELEVYELSDDEKEEFRSKIESVYETFQTTDRTKELFDSIQDAIEQAS